MEREIVRKHLADPEFFQEMSPKSGQAGVLSGIGGQRVEGERADKREQMCYNRGCRTILRKQARRYR